jgi:hypothetical protein
MWLRFWFKRLTDKWFGRRLAASIAPRRRSRKQPDVRPEPHILEARYTPAMLAALRQLKDMYLDIKLTDALGQELAKLNELQTLGMNVLLAPEAGLEGLSALKLPATPRPARKLAAETIRTPATMRAPAVWSVQTMRAPAAAV